MLYKSSSEYMGDEEKAMATDRGEDQQGQEEEDGWCKEMEGCLASSSTVG